MTIRHAVIGDLPRIVEMGQHFLHSTSYDGQFADNPDQIAALATMLITSLDGLLLVAEEDDSGPIGMIGMLVYDHLLSGERVAGEVIWWVEPDTRGGVGVRLLQQAEAWAAQQDVRSIQMIAPNADVGKIYERHGYRQIEIGYQRMLA